jgi:hypothetical protein
MKNMRLSFAVFALLLLLTCAPLSIKAQEATTTVLTGAQLTRVVPNSFYFQGQSAQTQIRNAAAARFGDKRFVLAGMVDTSGYSVEVRAKYEGFLITDSPITVGGTELGIGAYGFGFSDDGKLNILDLGGNQILSVATTKDSSLRRPRPLMMTKASDGVRLYSGRNYAIIAVK